MKVSSHQSISLRIILAVAVLLSAFSSLRPSMLGRAATQITVTTTLDAINTDGYCSLREAIIAANKDQASSSNPGECPAGSGADTIILPAGVYLLTRTDSGKEDASSTGDLDITSDIALLGQGGPVQIDAVTGFKDRIFHILSGNVTIQSVWITDGNSSANGGAILNLGNLTLRNSTISGNKAGGVGGGIYSTGTTNLFNATVSGNASKTNGGGLAVAGGVTTLNNATITSNTADSDSNGSGNGGGVFRSAGTLNARNSIFAANLDLSSSQQQPDCSGAVNSQGYNLVQNLTGCVLGGSLTGNVTGVSANLGTLQNNGGLTLTHALLSGSPAINSANPALPGSGGNACEATDQRGVTRPQGLLCDMGAFEVVVADPPQPGPVFTVNSSQDTDDGICGVINCTLREGLHAADARPNGSSPDQIVFGLPGTAPFTLSPVTALPPVQDSVVVDGANQLIIDGSQAGAGAYGLTLSGSGILVRNLVIQNFQGDGIHITGNNNTIQNNTLQNNGGAGVAVIGGTGNQITTNTIYNNAGLGIDLETGGVTANDPADVDAGGNQLLNFPVLLRAIPTAQGLEVHGRVNTAPDAALSLEFFTNPSCDPTLYGEGQTYLGSASVTTDASGDAYFKTILTGVASGFITANATDAGGNTSEFSQCLKVGDGNDSWVFANTLNPQLTVQDVYSATATQTIDLQGQSRWYKFQVEPGSRVVVTLTNLQDNYDLTLYKDINAALQAQKSSALDLNKLGAEFAPDSFAPDSFAPDSFAPDGFSPDSFAPDSFAPDSFAADVFAPDSFAPDSFAPDSFAPDSFAPDSFAPDSFAPDSFAPDSFAPDSFAPDSFAPDSFASAQTSSLIGVSAFNGTASEGIMVNTWDTTGDFYVRVRGRNGQFNMLAPFRLNVLLMTGSCNPVSTALPASTTVATAGGFRTIILTDMSRMDGSTAEKDAVLQRLAALSGRPEVQAVMVDLSADARVAAANVQADTYPDCPFAKNVVGSSIKEIIDRYDALNPLEYIVLVGNDNVIPFFRHPDHAMLGNEKNYYPPVRNQTASKASLKLGYFLSQERYGARVEISSKITSLPLPALAVGRLVETPLEVNALLDAYLATPDGVISTPTSSLVTGYDFLTDAATEIKNELDLGIGSPGSALIAPRDLAPTDPATWTAADLEAAVTGSRHDILFLAGHFSANSALAADFSTRFDTTELMASPVDLTNALVFSAGCHAGYNVVNAHAVPFVTRQPDWAQAFASKGAYLIAGTGYQYGDTDFIEYSERLYLEFSRQLRTGTGPVAIGKALVAAKQAYLAGTPWMRGIHEKALLQATLFGLPMAAVNMPGQRLSEPVDQSIVGSTTGFTTDPGATLGLRYADVSLPISLTRHDFPLSVVASGTVPTTTVTATYFSAADGVVVNPGEPVMPLVSPVVGVAGAALRGVVFLHGTYTDYQNIMPLLGAATTELRGVHTSFQANYFYPVRTWNANYFDTLNSANPASTRLGLIPAQFMSNATGAVDGTMRAFSQMDFRLFYSDNTSSYQNGSTPALAGSPSIAAISAIPGPDAVQYAIRVIGNPAAGIQQVWVTYTGGAYAGAWSSLALVQNQQDSTLWEGSLPLNGSAATDLRYFVQAVNGVGLVGQATNLGAYYIPGVNPNPSLTTALALTAAQPDGPYGTQATFSAVLSSAGAPLAGELVVFNVGPQTRVALTDQSGQATVAIPLLGNAGETTAQAMYPGSLDYAPSTASLPFTILKQATNLTLGQNPPIRGQYSDGAAATVTLADAGGRRLGEKTLIFTIQGNGGSQSDPAITDYAGRAPLEAIFLPAGSYNFSAQFSGVITVNGETLDLDDERYFSSSLSSPMQVLPEDASISNTGALVVQLGGSVTLSTIVTQADDGSPGDITLAQVQFTVRQGATVIETQTVPVNADGSASAVLATSLGAGLYQVDTQVVGNYFSSPVQTVDLTVNTAPSCSTATIEPYPIWPPDNSLVQMQVVVSDPDGDLVSVLVTAIRQDEPVGTGPQSPDAFILGLGSFQLRAERDQNGDGRVYHVFFTADDGHGGTCSGETTVGVSPDQGGRIAPIDGGPLYDSTIPG